jgi:diadenosine tetraphosphate (Ap4A) HIT family hydrolase
MKTKDFLGNEWDIDCMGCAISEGTMLVPGGFIKRTQYFCVHQDPLIPLPGFLVIASMRHIQSISDMEEDEYENLSKLIRDAHHAIKEVTRTEHLTLIQEESSVHFHLWFFPWTEGVVKRYGKPSLPKIREIMADYRTRSIDDVEWKVFEKSLDAMKVRMA